ncbi:DUF4129 domain-containing protein [Dechloromonas sp. H13]|uniref:DUF4129 domain-containing protein n=1 Tax=Dechloromonas sp. H13 TaxID=2570193 RepID=UPI001290E29B|nr:DUF4129 domain-containing protein [Dechloromonas sp. H13]
MSPPLTYLPAYLGLYASLLLAVACNAFLDIRYGSFGFEMFLWAAVFGWTLLVGWKQHGQANESGPQQQKAVLLLGAVVSILIFIPMWGFPRAGLYILVILQASMNCVTTTRRQLHFGLLVSAVMVMFAATHYRADWTMLFYLIPYIVTVVFTLVSEQVSRRALDLRQASLAAPTHAGQGLAIASATAVILGIGAMLYIATPQVSWPYLQWRYGQATNIGWLWQGQEHGGAGQAEGDTTQSGQGTGSGQEGSGGQGQGSGAGSSSGGAETEGESGQGYELLPGRGWPTPAEMREAASRPGMPAWQSAAIRQMASLDEDIRQALAPIIETLEALMNSIRQWLEEHRTLAWLIALSLLALVLLAVLILLLREARAGIWLRTRFDYLRLGMLGRHPSGVAGARRYYQAMERLFALSETPRAPSANCQEFLQDAIQFRDGIRVEASEMTRLFELYRYGPREPDPEQLGKMRLVYRALFRKMS